MPNSEAARCLAVIARYLDGPVQNVAVCFVGDGRHPLAGSLLTTGASLGMDVRVAAPRERWPSEACISRAQDVAAWTGAGLLVTSDVGHAVLGAEFVCTDVADVPGESDGEWAARTGLPALYRVTDDLLDSTGTPRATLILCVPTARRAAGPVVPTPGRAGLSAAVG
jgi:ornithine carbamoyltransferase